MEEKLFIKGSAKDISPEFFVATLNFSELQAIAEKHPELKSKGGDIYIPIAFSKFKDKEKDNYDNTRYMFFNPYTKKDKKSAPADKGGSFTDNLDSDLPF